MFTLKANSKQKCIKRTQEREIGNAVREHFAWAKDCSLKQTTSSSCSLTARFLTPKPKFWSPNIPIRFQRLFTSSCTQKSFQKHIKHEIKYHFNTIHLFNPFLQNPQQQLNWYHKFVIMNTQGMNHQQHLMTTTTSIKHKFINHPSTTIHSSSILGKTQVYMYMKVRKTTRRGGWIVFLETSSFTF